MDIIKKFLEKYKRINKKNLLLVLSCIVILVVLIFYGINSKEEKNPNNNVVNTAQVAKSVSMIFHSMEEIKANEKDYFPNDNEKWYEKYMNMMYVDTYYGVKEVPPTEKEVMSSFTYGDLDKLYTNIGVVDEELLSYVKNNKPSTPIKLETWNEIYGIMVERLDVDKKIKVYDIVISGTVSKDENLKEWTATTTLGQLRFEGLAVDYYIDKRVFAAVKDGELLAIYKVNSENVTYNNCWIISMSGGKIQAYVEGCVREFITNDKTANYSNVIADLTLEDSKLKEIIYKSETVSGKVLSASRGNVEIENVGMYPVDESCKVYKMYGNIEMCDISEVLVGYDAQKFVLNEQGKVCAIVIDRDVEATNIRVLIKNTGFNELLHETVTVLSQTGCIVYYGNEGKAFEIEAGKEYIFKPDSEELKSGRIKIKSKGIDGKIGITSIKRGYGEPYYRGDIEIAVINGKLLIVNELPLEEYLYSVVPSEMPWSYSYEALKAQAVCARSFAYLHIRNNRYSEYGAHVDDSTTYQVYNNSKEQTVTNAAVDDTYGQVLTHGDNVISAYFFSTSCGSTTTSAVWGSTVAYTSATLLSDEQTGMNLMDETTFDAFIRTNYTTYDSEYPWYRWKVTMSLDELTSSINSQIGSVKKENVEFLSDKGQWVHEEVSSVGQVKKIELGEREPGGVLKYITIIGTEATVKVYKEYNIRKVLNPKGIAISRATGDEVTTMTMLPSGFFVIDEVTEDNLLSAYAFVGGGYGHGVGMSQNGANAMAKLGKSSEEILKFFYKGVELKKLY